MSDTKNPIRISNRSPWLETVILSLLFLGCVIGALYQFLEITYPNMPALTSPAFWIGTIITVSLLRLILWARTKRKGSLVISLENKTFSVNGHPHEPFSNLNFYKSILNSPTRRGPFSSMSIQLGSREHGAFTVSDADRFFFNPVGRSETELNALQELVNGSSLTEEQKQSFSNWHGRANLIHIMPDNASA